MTTAAMSVIDAPSAPKTDLTLPLTLASDQPERWINYGDAGVPFDRACEDWHAERAKDGEVEDLQVGDLSTWSFGPVGQTAALAPIPVPGRPRYLVPLRRRAFTQLCGLIGAPSNYLTSLPARYQLSLVNHGLQALKSSEKSALVRGVGGEARAILSDRYAPLDGERVLDTVRHVLRESGQLGSVRVRSLAVGSTASLRLTFPEHDAVIQHSRKVGDIVEVGLDVLNGEVGNRALSISPLTWRLICLNGMRSASTEDASRFRHVGDPERLHQAFADALPVAIAGGQRLRDLMQKATEVLIDDALAEFDLSAFGFTPTESQDVARDAMAERSMALPASTKDWGDAFAEVRDLTAYDVANAITHVAQTRGTDRRVEMEEAAGRYLDRTVRRAA